MPNTDKTILLPQLQRYDQKIKGWADAKFLTKADTPSLPKATATTLGGVKVGNGLNVTDDGILSAKTHGSETSITTSITATRDNTGTWNAVCEDTYNVIVSWFDNYDRVFAWVNSGENSLRPFPEVFVELIKKEEGLIVSTTFTIQYVVPSNNPHVRIGTTTTSLCHIYFDANGSIGFQEDYSNVDQYADATEFTNTVNEDISMLALKDGGITSAKLADGAVTAAKLASNAVTSDKITNGAVSSVKIASNAVTADKIADGAITADKLANGVGGGAEFTEIFKSHDFANKITIEDSIRFIAGDFYCYIINYYVKSSNMAFTFIWKMKDIDGNFILFRTTSVDETFQTFVPVCSDVDVPDYRTIMGFLPRAESAQAALASLRPVQDECEQMEAEVAKLEQDWIDNQDDIVAVDGNGVPITIATKKTELEKKKAELEKLREDYFSKLGDWKK